MYIKTYGTYLTIYTKWLWLNGIEYEIQEPTWQHINMDKVWIVIPRQDTKAKRKWIEWWKYNVLPLLMESNNKMLEEQKMQNVKLMWKDE